jgi:hypothetical protein
MPKRFTLAEAESQLPELERRLGKAIALKAEYDEAEGVIQAATEKITAMGGMLADRDAMLAARARRDGAARSLQAAIERVQQTGCLLKDLDIGLVDFTCRYRGEDVCLCWKLGEPAIRFWHGETEGFRGRKPIDEDFRKHHTRGESEE